MMRLVLALGLLAGGAVATAADPREAGLAQWRQIESVLTHPRCLNCHTATDYPRQADDRHPHAFNVSRGPDGHGAKAAQCSMCHHEINADMAGVPGARGWHLPPLSMAWERSPGVAMASGELCRVLTDRRRNGQRSAAQLIEHHADEPLVQWAWSPGHRPDGTPRVAPPLSHDEFVAATREWAAAGAPCPR
jgi:hypothetical protein